MINPLQLYRWSHNTKRNHKKRGIQIQSTPTELQQLALQTLIQNSGNCPSCGQPLNQKHLHPQQLTLDILPQGDYEIVCRTCNQNRAQQNRCECK